MAQTYVLQNPAGGNAYVTVRGRPEAGATLYSQPYNTGSPQQWIPAQYPGNDQNNQGGVVCVLYTASASGLVMTAGPCRQPNTLQAFQLGNLYQLWAYKGTAGGQGRWLNCGTGCVLDLAGGDPTGVVGTWEALNNGPQTWKLQTSIQAQAVADAAPALEAVGAD
jgi:hypothetical protein